MKGFFSWLIGFLAAIIRPLRFSVRSALTLLELSCVLCVGQAANAQSITRVRVDGENGLGSPTGTPGDSWTNAFKHVQDALAYAAGLQLNPQNHVHIWVRGDDDADGIIYRPDEDAAHPTGTNPPDAAARAKTFKLRDFVRIYGGFDTNETGDPPTQFLQREPLLNLTVLSGDLDLDSVLDADNSYHVVSGIAVGPEAIIDGFTIRDGYAVDAPFPGYPDSALNPDAVPIHAGAGMYIMSRNAGLPGLPGNPVVLRCTFVNNRADLGGAVLIHCAATGSATGGVLFEDCVFRSNVADTDGGGIYNYGMSGATEPEAECPNYSSAMLVNCLFHDNTADAGGGYWGDFTSSVTAINSTIVHNSTGIYQQANSGCGKGWLFNTIVYSNNPPSGSGADQINGEFCRTYSDVQGASSGGSTPCNGNIAASPLFADPAGGDTIHGTADDNYRLTSSSPCIDKGDTGPNCPYNWDDAYDLNQNAYTATEGPPDLDLKNRVIRQIGNAFAQSLDMGAYEFGTGCTGDTNGDDLINIDDILSIVNGWGPCPAPPGTCPGDVTLHLCSEDDAVVDIDDMLIVINSWGQNCITHGFDDVGSLSSVEDCMEAATNEELEPFSEEWDDFVNKCVDGLCAAEIIVCD